MNVAGEIVPYKIMALSVLPAAQFDLEIVAAPTLREPDGLALSSRNVRLGPEARRQAVALVRALDVAGPRKEMKIYPINFAPVQDLASILGTVLTQLAGTGVAGTGLDDNLEPFDVDRVVLDSRLGAVE